MPSRKKPRFPRAISFQEQGSRLEPAFDRIQTSVTEILAGADLTASPAEASPDRALVFDVIGPVANFVAAARATGLEWLAEDVGPEASEDEDSEYDEDDVGADTLLYVTMPTLDGLRRVLALWRRFVRGETRPADAREWWALFGYLRDVRTWSAQDRVDPLVQAYVERTLRENPGRPIRLELDLWFRDDPGLRGAALGYVSALVETMGGSVLDFATIEEIDYQAALVEVPGGEAAALRDMAGPLATADPIMRIRPQSLFVTTETDPLEAEVADRAPPEAVDPRPAIAALLDGYPVQNHVLLANRVDVSEVDVLGTTVPVARRMHGTSMASLIVHGDLGSEEPPIDRTLKIIPILAAPAGLAQECTPLDRLPIALVHRAVTALIAGVDGGPALGRQVVVINHSICDQQAPFARRPSPWAKLLDHLSHEHGLLFVVSAGNSREPFALDTYSDCDEFAEADSDERQVVVLRSLERAKGTRLILSPAEAVNALTVGALHDDAGGECPAGLVEPFDSVTGVTNLASSVGLGINRGIKPEVVEAGGRQLAATHTEDDEVVAWARNHPDLGQLAATTDPVGGTRNRLARTTGTSNAAALVTRSAIRIAGALDRLFADDGQVWHDAATRAVALKVLLVHGCSWGDTHDLLDAIYPPAGPRRWARRREAISRFLGYGRADVTRILSAGGHRITLLADDEIGHEGRHEYRIPIPRSMISNREVRRLVLTLAWSSPIEPSSARYRGIALDLVDATGRRAFWKGVGTSGLGQPHPEAARRGTVQHLVLHGRNLVKATREGHFIVGVQARAVLPSLVGGEVPYAMAVTLELAQPLRQDLFADVAERIRPKSRVRARSGVRVRGG